MPGKSKKLNTAAIGIAIFLLLTVTMTFANTKPVEMEMTINNERVTFEDVHPYVNEDGRTMVPVRFISENLGAEVSWDGATQTVTVEKGNNVIALQVNSDMMTVNGEQRQMDTPMVFNQEQGRNFVPLRFVSENLESDLYWAMIDGVHTIDIEEHSWIEEFWGDWDGRDYGFEEDWLPEALDEAVAEQILNEILEDFQTALGNQDFAALDNMHFHYQEFIDDFSAMFFPESAFDITFHDVVITESYAEYIAAEAEFDYVNYYRLNLLALTAYFDMLENEEINPDESSKQEIQDFLKANNYMKQLEEVEQQRYVRPVEIEKINQDWLIIDFSIQTGYMWQDDINEMAKQLTMEEIFEFSFLEMRMMFLFFGGFAGEFDADSEASVKAAMVAFEEELEEMKEEMARQLGYDSYQELIQVEQGTEEFYRIIDELYGL